MSYTENAILFDCSGDQLVGILAEPTSSAQDVGVVVVVGGPQYRVGSHRQFVDLSRTLARAGVPCLRFDYRGMGDSEGTARDFSDVNGDIAAAIDTFLAHCPSVGKIVLWGLCDGASAAAFRAATDLRVSGLVLLNPWVHTEEGEATAYLKHYYIQRLTSAALWRKLRHGEFSIRRSAKDAWQLLKRATVGRLHRGAEGSVGRSSLPDQLRESLGARKIETLILLSGKDFVAREFDDLVKGDKLWAPIMAEATVRRFPQADHTFSDPRDSLLAAETTRDWLMRR